jgi:hypothetical protein
VTLTFDDSQESKEFGRRYGRRQPPAPAGVPSDGLVSPVHSRNEAQFATRSRLLGEPGPRTDLALTPGARRAFQLGVGYRF